MDIKTIYLFGVFMTIPFAMIISRFNTIGFFMTWIFLLLGFSIGGLSLLLFYMYGLIGLFVPLLIVWLAVTNAKINLKEHEDV